MQAIILLAGQGKRMGELTVNNHKSLLPISETESFLSRLFHQLNEYPFDNVVLVTGFKSELIEKEASKFQLNFTIVKNEGFASDTNIKSMKLALDVVDDSSPVIVFEGDIWLEDLALKKIYESSLSKKSIWFTRGKFQSPQYGGILKASNNGDITDIKIVPEYQESLYEYDKLLGVMTFGPKELETYKNRLNEVVSNSIDAYYLIPWMDNLKALPCKNVSLEGLDVVSVNRKEEYQDLYNELNKEDTSLEVVLENVQTLMPIEEHIHDRFLMLKDKIEEEKRWIKPIVIDEDDHCIMDGHHRFAVAKSMGLKYVPVVKLKYSDIKIWSLRQEEYVDHATVVSRAKKGDIYPNKTVKHDFRMKLPVCNYSIDELK